MVDNEHLNRKKSKICCLFKKQKHPDDFSSSSEDDEEKDRDPNVPNQYEIQPKSKPKPKIRKAAHNCQH